MHSRVTRLAAAAVFGFLTVQALPAPPEIAQVYPDVIVTDQRDIPGPRVIVLAVILLARPDGQLLRVGAELLKAPERGKQVVAAVQEKLRVAQAFSVEAEPGAALEGQRRDLVDPRSVLSALGSRHHRKGDLAARGRHGPH